jgi:D-alanyl-D-alanine carboxypeptidase
MLNALPRRPFLLPLLLFAAVLLGGGSRVEAQEAKTDPVGEGIAERIADRCRERLATMHEEGIFPGASLAFVLPDGTPITVVAGFADPDTARKMSPDDRLMAGSTGKTYVAAAAMRLVLAGKMSLDDPLSRWLGKREWFDRLPNASELTLRSLLQHTSGIPEYYDQREFLEILPVDPKREWSPEELIAFVLDDPPRVEAGKGWSYADTNFLLVGLVIEEVSGEPFYDQVREHLLRPHELHDTIPTDRCTLPGVVQGTVVMGRFFGYPERSQKEGEFVFNPQFEWCGGGFATTPLDLARWGRILYSGAALKGEYLDEMIAGVPTRRLPEERYGLGTFLQETKVGPMQGHDGFFPGYLTSLGYFSEHRFAAALQINTDDVRSIGVPSMHLLLEPFAVIAAEELAWD